MKDGEKLTWVIMYANTDDWNFFIKSFLVAQWLRIKFMQQNSKRFSDPIEVFKEGEGAH